MIEGNGDIASVLEDRDDRIYFARGVSNSQEKRDSEYQRERDMLLNQDRDKRLVYFSSLAVFYGYGKYANHKRDMETMIKTEFPFYTIIRLGNIDWGINPHTLINYLKAHPEAPIQDVYRYVTNKEEFLHWINLIPDFNCEINIPGERLKVSEIARRYTK